MFRIYRRHPATIVGWLGMYLGLSCIWIANLVAAPTADPAARLAIADGIKTSDNEAFVRILDELDADAAHLSAREKSYLAFLEGWQTAYKGNLAGAITRLGEVEAQTPDPTLKFRALVTIVNAKALSARYLEAYTDLNSLLEILPGIREPETRSQGLIVAAILYNQAGQYDLALAYAKRLLLESDSRRIACQARQLQIEALHRNGALRLEDPRIAESVEACTAAKEPLYTNSIRSFVARLQLDAEQPDKAIKLLLESYPEVKATRYPRLVSEFEALLATAYWRLGIASEANNYALRAIDSARNQEPTRQLADSYAVLSGAAESRGEFRSALDYERRHMTADKGYLTAESARMLAYQTVRQQVQARKAEVDALSKRNQVLQLQQKVSKSAAETRGLYILLLLSVLGFIAMWLYKTKRSQLHFMKLARRDGLTGIFNRNHFGDAAESVLSYARRSDREACAIIIDLDHFKEVNDRYGHEMGDQVLRRTVKACQPHLRSIDVMGRLGGEEFGVVLPDCDMERAVLLANRFCESIASLSIADSGFGFPISASLGVTSSKLSGYELRQLLMHADAALYKAKREGRNRIEMFDGTTFEAPPSTTGEFDRRTT